VEFGFSESDVVARRPNEAINVRLALLALVISVALIGQSALADHSIVLTETSSTNLSVTYDGLASGINVSNTGPDRWDVTFSADVELGFFAAWVEPENSDLVNFVGSSNPGGTSNLLRVSSDIQFEGAAVGDGSTVANVGIDSTDQGSISAAFHDDAPEAIPEPSTAALFLLALIGWFAATCLRPKAA
jgi:hypothetical protein